MKNRHYASMLSVRYKAKTNELKRLKIILNNYTLQTWSIES